MFILSTKEQLLNSIKKTQLMQTTISLKQSPLASLFDASFHHAADDRDMEITGYSVSCPGINPMKQNIQGILSTMFAHHFHQISM